MKDHIQENYGLEEKPTYDFLRKYVNGAWEALLKEFLKRLLASMPHRCADVIAANGMHIKW